MTSQGPDRPRFQGTRPAPSGRAWGDCHTTRSPTFNSKVRRYRLASLALAAEAFSQWPATLRDNEANCANCFRPQSETGSNCKLSLMRSFSRSKPSDQDRSRSLGVNPCGPGELSSKNSTKGRSSDHSSESPWTTSRIITCRIFCTSWCILSLDPISQGRIAILNFCLMFIKEQNSAIMAFLNSTPRSLLTKVGNVLDLKMHRAKARRTSACVIDRIGSISTAWERQSKYVKVYRKPHLSSRLGPSQSTDTSCQQQSAKHLDAPAVTFFGLDLAFKQIMHLSVQRRTSSFMPGHQTLLERMDNVLSEDRCPPKAPW